MYSTLQPYQVSYNEVGQEGQVPQYSHSTSVNNYVQGAVPSGTMWSAWGQNSAPTVTGDMHRMPSPRPFSYEPFARPETPNRRQMIGEDKTYYQSNSGYDTRARTPQRKPEEYNTSWSYPNVLIQPKVPLQPMMTTSDEPDSLREFRSFFSKFENDMFKWYMREREFYSDNVLARNFQTFLRAPVNSGRGTTPPARQVSAGGRTLIREDTPPPRSQERIATPQRSTTPPRSAQMQQAVNQMLEANRRTQELLSTNMRNQSAQDLQALKRQLTGEKQCDETDDSAPIREITVAVIGLDGQVTKKRVEFRLAAASPLKVEVGEQVITAKEANAMTRFASQSLTTGKSGAPGLLKTCIQREVIYVVLKDNEAPETSILTNVSDDRKEMAEHYIETFLKQISVGLGDMRPTWAFIERVIIPPDGLLDESWTVTAEADAVCILLLDDCQKNARWAVGVPNLLLNCDVGDEVILEKSDKNPTFRHTLLARNQKTPVHILRAGFVSV